MNKLILPNEPTQLILPKSSRRGFMQVLAGVMAAPMIVPITNLMQIHRIENKLIVAVTLRSTYDSFPSLLNLGDYNQEMIKAWGFANDHSYSLVRLEEIPPERRDYHGGLGYYKGHKPSVRELAQHRDSMMSDALKRYRTYMDLSPGGIILPT